MPRHPRIRTAFTLTELLVVILIIAILIAVLIPTISSVRRSAMVADTRNLISQISNAITRYHQDFNAYPGPFRNDQIVTGTLTINGASGVTMTENLTLALLGGLRRDGSNIEFVEGDLRQALGPMSLSTTSPRRYTAYMSVREGMLSDGQMSATVAGMSDSVVPEFVDTWPIDDKLPIIYMRARTGASGIISDASTSGSYQYDRRFLIPYLRSGGDGLTALGDFSDDNIVDHAAKGNAVRYFAHPSLHGGVNATGTPVAKDRFVLIAAGADRIYGTQDDITSWGN